ncbi:MAG: septum site-determining protein MinC [Thiotrichaceae bacterium]|nr:septum site-determining protein MinC [Thiotrichaceae bacterium]
MAALELKGNLLTLMVLHLLETNIDNIANQLAEKVSKAPMFFQQAPVVIDLNAVSDENGIDLLEVITVVRHSGLIPIAVRGGNSQQQEMALSLNLGILTNTIPTNECAPEIEDPSISIPSQTKIVTQPIRSGQQVVALNGDLIVLAAVSHGAEVLAHRHIHIYGALRGRALAGVNGDSEARIFCQQFNAELLSVAGQYMVNEDLPEDLLGKPVQVYLQDKSLKIISL